MYLRTWLPDHTSWNPSVLLANTNSSLELAELPLKPLGELVEELLDRELFSRGSWSVSARSLDHLGNVKIHPSKSDSFGIAARGGKGLDAGDLVIFPGRPVLRVSSHMSGIAVIGNFLALRPKDTHVGLWLWAIFNSSIGQKWLENSASQSGSVMLRLPVSLLTRKVSIPTFVDKGIADALAQVSSLNDLKIAEGLSSVDTALSFTKRVQLRSESDWAFLFASEVDLSHFAGQLVSNFIDSVEVGKQLVAPVLSRNSNLPLVTHRTVSAGEYLEVPDNFDGQTRGAGTLVIVSHGEKSLAAVTDREAAIGPGVFALNLKPGVDANWLRDFFNSNLAQKQRKSLLKGVAIKYLTKSSLGEFRVPKDFDEILKPARTLKEVMDGILGF